MAAPDGASQAQEVHLFATTVGGATSVSSGNQMRLVVRRDAGGWWLDPQGQMRVYCDRAFSGFGGNSCR
jgi:hypothetical protein